MNPRFLHQTIVLMTLLCVSGLVSCRKAGTEKSPETTVETHRWNPTNPIVFASWQVDGKWADGRSAGAGPKADGLLLKIIRHRNSIGYEVQYSPTDLYSGTLRWDPGNTPEIVSPADGVLPIEGPTSVLLFRERTPDGKIAKTRELFLSNHGTPYMERHRSE